MLLSHGRWSKLCKLRSIVQKMISEPNSYFRPCGTFKWQPSIPQWCHKYAIAGKKFNSFNLCILTFLDLVLITSDCMAIQKISTYMRTKIINTVWTKQIRRQTDRHTHTGFEEGKSSVWLVGFLTSSSTTRLYRGRAPRQSVWQFYVLPHMRQSWETMTSISAGHIILTPTQPVGSGRPQRGSNPGPPYQESRALPAELPRPPKIIGKVKK